LYQQSEIKNTEGDPHLREVDAVRLPVPSHLADLHTCKVQCGTHRERDLRRPAQAPKQGGEQNCHQRARAKRQARGRRGAREAQRRGAREVETGQEAQREVSRGGMRILR
jgi:hypothetical protein